MNKMTDNSFDRIDLSDPRLKGQIRKWANEPYDYLQKTEPPKRDNNPLDYQVAATHYKGYKIQPVEFAMANNLDLCQANVVKYTLRFRDKGGIEDLKKAIHYLKLLAHFEYQENI